MTAPGSEQPRQAPNHRRIVMRLGVAVVAMFGFGFALVPMYDAICKMVGVNGKTGGQVVVSAEDLQPDLSRTVEVQFVTGTNESMPWEFRAETVTVQVHPGQRMQVSFYVKNPTQQRMVAQAVPSVSPGAGAEHFKKIECFCFQQQVLEAGAEAHMPLIFFIDHALPTELHELTLSYTLFDITDRAASTPSAASAVPASKTTKTKG